MSVFKKFDDILTSRWMLWGISVLIAVFMWFYVMDRQDPVSEKRKFLCRLEYRNLAPDLVAKYAIKEIEAEVEASESVMEALRYDSIVCEIDLRGLSSGRYRERVRAVMPQNVRLVGLNPSEVDIELLRQATRVFTVEVTLPHDLPEGQYLESVKLVPKEVAIRGTEKDLAKIGAVSIIPTFTELEAGRELFLPVDVSYSEPFEDKIEIEPQNVRMDAALAHGFPRKKVAVNVRLSGKPSSDYAIRSVTTDPVEVMLEGPKALLDNISAIDTETVNVSDISADQVLVVPLRPAEDSQVSLVGERSVRLRINLAPIAAQKQFTGIPVALKGEGGKKWRVTPLEVDVTVEVAPSVVERLSSGDVGLKAFVDVSGLFLRTATLPVRVSFASADIALKAVKIDPSTVTVNAVDENR